jgi:large subunit ribosomal protein L18
MKRTQRQHIRARIRSKISGTAERPRVHVSLSNRFLYVQAIDDVAGKTLAGLTSRGLIKGTKTEQSTALGVAFAKLLSEAKITTIVFDRGTHRFHGRIKAFAEAMRANSIQF